MADDILELQRAFDDAELRGDGELLGGLLADDFLSIGEQGYQLGKQEWIGRHGVNRLPLPRGQTGHPILITQRSPRRAGHVSSSGS